jgi:hypothetical protein
MVEKRLGCYVPVCTRTRRVGTGGHSTGGWCWQVLASSCNCIRVQRSLKVTWRPKACFGSVDGTNVPGMPFVGGSKRFLRKEETSFRRRCFLTSWTYRACPASGPRGCCVLCTPQITLSPRIEDGIVTWRTPHLEKCQEAARCTVGKRVLQSRIQLVGGVILSWSKGQAEL